MTDVLIVGDTERVPEMRHEVPLMIPDPFFYAERDERRIVVIGSMEIPRIEEAGAGLEAPPLEEFGADELLRAGLDTYAYRNELTVRVARARDERDRPAAVPARRGRRAPEGRRRAHGRPEALRRPAPSEDRVGARRDPTGPACHGRGHGRRSSCCGGGAAERRPRARRRRALTCELLKERVQAVFLRHGAFSDEPIVSHGPQTAVGHDTDRSDRSGRRDPARPLPRRISSPPATQT